jgi:hypothetical protein
MKNFAKLNFSNIKNVLSKSEMKMIRAGSGYGDTKTCNCNTKDDCKEAGKGLCYNCGSGGAGDQKCGYCAA